MEKPFNDGASSKEIDQLGFTAGDLLSAILEVKNKPNLFKSYLELLEGTLTNVSPVIESWRRTGVKLEGHQRKNFFKLSEKMGTGVEVVRKCPKVHSWNFIQKIRYSVKLGKLDEYMTNFFNLEMKTEIWRDNKQLLLDFQEVLKKVEGLSVKQGRNNGSKGVFAVPRIPEHVVGFKVVLSELKNELLKEDVKLLGICGPGGCGKSTLAAMLCKDDVVQGKFKNILFLNVSRTPNIRVILRTLLEQIGGQVPESDVGDEDAIKQLQFFVKQTAKKPLLLVLDDVWDEQLIEKFSFGIEGYKLLVTSRELFKIYDDKYHSKYSLGILNEQDAREFFRHVALAQDGNENYIPDEDLLNEIVRCCDGFPLAIKVIAKSLCGQPAKEWQRVARKLSEGSSVLDFNKYLIERLATSLDSLEEVVLDCFLDLGNFRENERIPASTLIDIWVELYELDDEDEAYVNLLELASRSLVDFVDSTGKNAGKIDDGVDGLFVTQHKLLRELAIYKSRQQIDNQNPQQIKRATIQKREKEGYLRISPKKQEEEQQPNARLLSVHTGEMCPESWNGMHLPDVEVLNLSFSARKYTLPPSMDNMRKLKVLIIVNYGRYSAELNLSDATTFCYMEDVKRVRLEKVQIPSLHKIETPMTNLHKISLSMCEIGQALRDCTIDVSEKLPNLVEINIDDCSDLEELPPWVCDIGGLQKLSLTNCSKLFALPEGIGNLTNLESLRLHACKGLSSLPESIGGLEKLRSFDISDCVDIKTLPDQMCKLQGLRKFDMRHCAKLKELPSCTTKLVQLREVICDENASAHWEMLQRILPDLKIRKFVI